MTKLSNAKKNVKSVQTVEINTVDVAADKVASTLVNRIALDASDKPVTRTALDASDLRANDHSFAGVEVDYALESTVVDLVNFCRSAVSENGGTYIEPVDPMAPYAHHMVKLSYVFDGMELDMGRIFRGWDASKEAHDRANDAKGPKVPVAIRCATSNELFFTAYPAKGARNVSVVSGTRQTSTRTVTSAGTTEEQRKAQEEARKRKEEERAAKAWDAMVDQAEKDNAKFDIKRDKELKEMAAKLAKAQAKLRNAPKEGTDNFEQFKLFSEEHGLTCMEGNHAMNVIKNRNDSNYGWKQKGKDFAEDFNKVLIGQFRVCAVAYAKTGKTDKSMKEAMRLVDKSYDENNNVVIPNGWYVIQD